MQNKVEKYLRKREEEIKLQKMDNTDTPLNTMEKLKEKQAATGAAYLVLPSKGAAAPAEPISLQKDTTKRKADGAGGSKPGGSKKPKA
jgi:hypothetical protein